LPPALKRFFVLVLSLAYLVLLLTLLRNRTRSTPWPMGVFSQHVPGWAQPLIAVGGPVLLVVVLVAAATRYPTFRLDAGLAEVIEEWRKRHPQLHHRWRAISLPQTSAYSTKPPEVALLRRYSTTVSLESIASTYRLSITAAKRADLDGLTVTGLGTVQHPSRVMSSTRTGGTRISRMTVAVDLPTDGLELAVSPLHGYRRTRAYRVLAVWRFRTGHRDFDDRYFVRANNRDRARRALSESVVPWLVADPRTEHLGLVFHRGVLSTQLRSEFAAEALDPLADYLVSVYQRIPSEVWRS
jgi:hypothetical protein